MNNPIEPVVDVFIDESWAHRALRADVVRALTRQPRVLPPKWFYDNRGSELFDQITRLPEYYPTEAERQILMGEAATIARASGAGTVIELGSGTSDKTRALLDCFTAAGQLERFVPFDVSEQTLIDATHMLAGRYPGLVVHGVVGDFTQHLDELPRGGTRMVAFLGGTIGNFYPDERAQFLGKLAATLEPGDSLLLGTDLVKGVARLEAAYDDSQGVTAEFNRNVLHVINRELGADFDPDAWQHRAFFDSDEEYMDLRLCSTRRQTVRVEELDIEVTFDEGEELLTEISAKFRRQGITAELAAAGLDLTHWWTDTNNDFALSLSFRR
ncbi:MAG: L-histidine N(alpha)-methyltransferase [Actinomycetia bacterium]|nr:L-histidine N(alpha)-methyltransferase [Actinomycetes bacterium]